MIKILGDIKFATYDSIAKIDKQEIKEASLVKITGKAPGGFTSQNNYFGKEI